MILEYFWTIFRERYCCWHMYVVELFLFSFGIHGIAFDAYVITNNYGSFTIVIASVNDSMTLPCDDISLNPGNMCFLCNESSSTTTKKHIEFLIGCRYGNLLTFELYLFKFFFYFFYNIHPPRRQFPQFNYIARTWQKRLGLLCWRICVESVVWFSGECISVLDEQQCPASRCHYISDRKKRKYFHFDIYLISKLMLANWCVE